MENQPRPILIPTDFTVVARYAVEAALKFARSLNTDIVLVHIVKKTSDILDATAKVTDEAEQFSKEFAVKITGIVREGTIFTTIGKTVEELDACLVIMGTHGAKGMQKLTGSWSLKVIVSSSVPIIVVQGHNRADSVRNIVFPIDFKKENREKIGWAHHIAKLFDSNVHIFRDKPAKDKKIEQGIRTNLLYTEKFLNAEKLHYEVIVAEGKVAFAKETLDYATKIEADLILITTTKGISFADYVLGPTEEEFLDNQAQIPVMCVNPRKAKFGSGFSATGGV